LINKNKFPDEAKRAIQKESYQDRLRLKDSMDVPAVLKNRLIEDLNHDLVSAMLCDAAIILDPVHKTALRKKSILQLSQPTPVPEEVAVSHLLSFAAPDFHSLSINEIIDQRESTHWKNFRAFVSEFTSELLADPERILDGEAMREEIHHRIDKALFSKFERLYPSYWRMVIDLGLGAISAIPGVGLLATGASSIKSISEVLRGRSVWYAFLLDLKAKTEK